MTCLIGKYKGFFFYHREGGDVFCLIDKWDRLHVAAECVAGKGIYLLTSGLRLSEIKDIYMYHGMV